MGKKFRVEYDREGCIGAGVCVAVDEKDWEMNADGKADLKGGKKDDDISVKEIDESGLEEMKAAAEGCPVNVIHIIDEKGKKLI